MEGSTRSDQALQETVSAVAPRSRRCRARASRYAPCAACAAWPRTPQTPAIVPKRTNASSGRSRAYGVELERAGDGGGEPCLPGADAVGVRLRVDHAVSGRSSGERGQQGRSARRGRDTVADGLR